MTFWQIWWIALAIKIAILPYLPMTPDETYYFMWARHPALSYFDHPPFVAWIMTAALPLWKTFFGIRLPGIIFSHLGFLPWMILLKKLGFSKQSILLWFVGLFVGPLTGLGAFLVTPDVPLVFFWGWSLLAASWTLEKPSILRWSVLGTLIGFGMLSKYVMVIFIPTFLVYLYVDKKFRELRKPGPWIGALIALLVFSPVLIWNFQHGFASFTFQAKHGLAGGAPTFQWRWPLEYISAQIGLLNPIAVAAAAVAICKRQKKQTLLTIFAIAPLAFFFLTSFKARVEANWPVCAYPSVMALAVTSIDLKNSKWPLALKMSFVASFLFLAGVISHTIHPWLPINKDRDHTEITREWIEDVAIVHNVRPLFARSYQMAAFHSYFREPKDEVYKLKGLDRTDVYDFLNESTISLSKNEKAYVVMKADDPFPPALDEKFRRKSLMILPSRMVLYELNRK